MQLTINYPFNYSYTKFVIYRFSYDAHYMWMHLIQIECEFHEFVFNALLNSHSCRWALKGHSPVVIKKEFWLRKAFTSLKSLLNETL